MKFTHRLSLVFLLLSSNGVFLKDTEYGWVHLAVFIVAFLFFLYDGN